MTFEREMRTHLFSCKVYYIAVQ